MSGLTLMALYGETIVEMVHLATPASEIGIKAGDRLIRVSGKPVGEFTTLFQIRRLLAQDGRTVTLSIRRGEQERECELLLANWQGVRREK